MKYLFPALLGICLAFDVWPMWQGTSSWQKFEEEFGDEEGEAIRSVISVPARQLSLPSGGVVSPVPMRTSSTVDTLHAAAETEVPVLSLEGPVDEVRQCLQRLAQEKGRQLEVVVLQVPDAKPHIVSAIFQELPELYMLKDLTITCENAPAETVWNMMRQAGVLAVNAGLTKSAAQRVMKLGLSEAVLKQIASPGKFYTTAPGGHQKYVRAPLYTPALKIHTEEPLQWHERTLLWSPLIRQCAMVLDVELMGQVQGYMRALTAYKPITGHLVGNDS